jgi:HD-GYP domain-containing protein (c-di-GMP phosphodiesterase class II)
VSEKAKEYISEQAGKQFDPDVAATFLRAIQGNKWITAQYS